jgi:phosphomannomutase/phosphoglucomutase
MNPRVFREYDIRGVADQDFPDSFVAELADAIAEHLREAGARHLTLGRDCRLSSPRIHAVMKARLVNAGLPCRMWACCTRRGCISRSFTTRPTAA